ncbi:MAG: DUF3667 domain-containing protein [Terrimonas sp.]|nr:DUF3667 domain-containing protein [Terrimonas sp.]
MSHAPERTEKNCLNCGTIVQGRYCHVCGQENIVPKESFWSLVIHFFYDITHFDGKFFHSLKYLVFRPGFLSAEFMKGRRATYLNPVRMYVFTSAFFFIIFFTFFKAENAINYTGNQVLPLAQKDSAMAFIRKELLDKPKSKELLDQLNLLQDSTREVTWMDLRAMAGDLNLISFGDEKYSSRREYDSLQQALPKNKRHSWFKRQLIYKEIEINDKYRTRPEDALKEVTEVVLHKLPYLLFVSLPLFALVLKLLYIRKKKFYYADHAIFSVHHYIFSFLLLLLILALNKLDSTTGLGIFNFFIVVLVLAWFFYLYKAMRNFYQQGRGKTILKFLLLNLSALFINVLLLLAFFFLSIFSV